MKVRVLPDQGFSAKSEPVGRNVINVLDDVASIISVAGNSSFGIIKDVRIEGPAAKGLSTLGWRFFQDSQYTDENPMILEANVRTKVSINGLGPLRGQYGTPSTNWLNSITSKIYPDKEGDFFFYRLNFYAMPSVNNKTLTVDFDIGTSNRIAIENYELNGGAGTRVGLSVTVPSGASATMVRNGGSFNMTSDSPMMISRVSLLAVKTFSVDG